MHKILNLDRKNNYSINFSLLMGTWPSHIFLDITTIKFQITKASFHIKSFSQYKEVIGVNQNDNGQQLKKSISVEGVPSIITILSLSIFWALMSVILNNFRVCSLDFDLVRWLLVVLILRRRHHFFHLNAFIRADFHFFVIRVCLGILNFV